MVSGSSGGVIQTDFRAEIASAMSHHASRFAYDDFLYLEAILDHIDDLDALAAIKYDDPSIVAREGGGDCTQLSAHFAATFLAPQDIPCHWVVSSDADYENSHRATLVPFRSTALVASEPSGTDLYLGVPLGHLRPLPIAEGETDYFWDKRYRISNVIAGGFWVTTQDGKSVRVRQYNRPENIDFQNAWRSMVRVKDHYSVTTYFDCRRRYIGYDLIKDRVYYSLFTRRLQSTTLQRFVDVYSKNRDYFESEFRRPRLETTLARMLYLGDRVRALLI